MTDDPVLAAVQKFMDAVEERLTAREEEIRSLLSELETRATPREGAPGKDGKDGIDGKPGADGKDGAPGKDGERGADGIATREELDAWFEKRAADLEARNLADVWKGVFKHGELYTRGAIAQWDGSPWLALKDTNAVPGTNGDWQLFAKKGRDGARR